MVYRRERETDQSALLLDLICLFVIQNTNRNLEINFEMTILTLKQPQMEKITPVSLAQKVALFF